jgi:hypothetical protein
MFYMYIFSGLSAKRKCEWSIQSSWISNPEKKIKNFVRDHLMIICTVLVQSILQEFHFPIGSYIKTVKSCSGTHFGFSNNNKKDNL